MPELVPLPPRFCVHRLRGVFRPKTCADCRTFLAALRDRKRQAAAQQSGPPEPTIRELRAANQARIRADAAAGRPRGSLS